MIVKHGNVLLFEEGGFVLRDIRVENGKIKEIAPELQAAEGELMPVSCLAMDGKPCDRSGSCITLPFWRGLEEHINAYVNSYTLRDLLEPRGQENNESRGSSACGGKEDKVL